MNPNCAFDLKNFYNTVIRSITLKAVSKINKTLSANDPDSFTIPHEYKMFVTITDNEFKYRHSVIGQLRKSLYPKYTLDLIKYDDLKVEHLHYLKETMSKYKSLVYFYLDDKYILDYEGIVSNLNVLYRE